MLSLQYIPNEIIELILFNLSARDVLSCSATSKQLRQLVQESSKLQLVIELAVSGLRMRNHAAVPHGVSAHDQLMAEKRSQMRWRSLKPKYMCSIPLDQFEYEVCDGLFGHGISPINQYFRGIEFNRINLSEEDHKCSVWRRYEDVGVNLTDFSFDVGNDLLVLAAAPLEDMAAKVLHLRTLSTNTDHPLAATSILRGPGSEEWIYPDIKIVGPYLAVHFGTPTTIGPGKGRLCIWKWQTGELIHTATGTSGFAFLSATSIAIVFLIEQDGDSITQIGILRIGALIPRVKLELPFLRHPDLCSVLSDRLPLDVPNPLESHKCWPYMIEETASKIFILQMNDLERHIFVAVKPLLELLEDAEARHAQSLASGAEKVDYYYYPWAAWGPENTFWLQPFVMEPGFTSVSGSRVCAVSHIAKLFDTDVDSGEKSMGILRSSTLGNEAIQQGTSILVMDFNMRPVERAHGNAEGEKDFAPKVRWETEVEGEIIVSTLPFRAFQVQQARYTELIATPQHIIGIREGHQGRFYDVLQYTE